MLRSSLTGRSVWPKIADDRQVQPASGCVSSTMPPRASTIAIWLSGMPGPVAIDGENECTGSSRLVMRIFPAFHFIALSIRLPSISARSCASSGARQGGRDQNFPFDVLSFRDAAQCGDDPCGPDRWCTCIWPRRGMSVGRVSISPSSERERRMAPEHAALICQ